MRKKLVFLYGVLTILTTLSLFRYRDRFIYKPNRIPSDNEENNFPTKEWIVNGIVTQYSSLISLNESNHLEIESLVFVNINRKDENLLNETLQCLIKKDDVYMVLNQTELHGIRIMPTKYGLRRLWRVRCVLNETEHNFNLENFYVSIIDSRDHPKLVEKFNLFLFHKPEFFSRIVPKIKSVANCVHMINNLDEHKLQKLLNWIKIQKEIGLHKIKLYFHLVPREIIDKVLKQNENFIEIVNHKTNFSDVCKWQIKKLEENPNSEDYNRTYKYCAESFKKFFDLQDLYVKNSHERVCSNDCYSNFKYVYEYVGNYDFDEFIFPRNFSKNYFLNLTLNSKAKCRSVREVAQKQSQINYDLYSYIKKLQNVYGKNIAYFQFENVLLLNEYPKIVKRILEIDQNLSWIISSNTTNFTNLLKYEINNTAISYKIDLKKDLNFLKSFKNFGYYIKCLNSSIRQNAYLNYKWNNLYGTVVNNREGKSIFNTNFTESYNQHFADAVKPKTKRAKIPIDVGYVSHFRDEDHKVTSTYPVHYLTIDIEYYNFLYRFSHKYKLK